MSNILDQIKALLPDNDTEEITESNLRESFELTFNYIKDFFSHLVVGGRNLLKGTGDMSGNLWMNKIVQGEYLGLSIAESFLSGLDHLENSVFQTIYPSTDEYYVLSFWAKSSSSTVINCSFISSDQNLYPNGVLSSESSTGEKSVSNDGNCSVTIEGNTWKRYWVKWRQTPTNGIKTVVVGRSFNIGASFQIAGVKLEIGKNATDWSPAPEDFFEKMTNMFKGLPDVTADSSFDKILVINASGNIGTINR